MDLPGSGRQHDNIALALSSRGQDNLPEAMPPVRPTTECVSASSKRRRFHVGRVPGLYTKQRLTQHGITLSIERSPAACPDDQARTPVWLEKQKDVSVAR